MMPSLAACTHMDILSHACMVAPDCIVPQWLLWALLVGTLLAKLPDCCPAGGQQGQGLCGF